MGSEHERLQATSSPWIAVNTHPHREPLTLDNLRRQDFEAYCPMIRKRRSHARRVDTVLRPLFPSYLFVRTNPELARWRPILSTYGVRNVVRVGDAPGFIDEGFVASLRAREVDGAIVDAAGAYQVGQQVQIASGPFDQVVATIIDMGEKDRLVLLLDMMNRRIKVQVASEQVVPA